MTSICVPFPRPHPTTRVFGNIRVEFTEEALLGKGSHARVYLAWRGDEPLACKQTKFSAKSASNKTAFDAELVSFDRLKARSGCFWCPSLVYFYGATMERFHQDEYGYMFLDLLARTTLQDEITTRARRNFDYFPRGEIWSLFTQIIAAVAFLHRHGVAHLDLKSENIAYDEASGNVTLLDLGLSYCHPQPVDATEHFPPVTFGVARGSPLYMAPETLRGEQYDPFAADMWSLGHVMIEIITLRHLFGHLVKMADLIALVHAPDIDPQKKMGRINKDQDFRRLVRSVLVHSPPGERMPAGPLGRLLDAMKGSGVS